MQAPSLGRRLRSQLVAAGVIGALALSMLPAATVSAAGTATRVNIINLAPSAIQGQNFTFQVEAVDALGARDTSYGGPATLLSFPGTSAGCVTTLIGIVFSNGLATVLNFACTTVGTATIGADTADLAAALATIQITSDRVLQFGSYPASSTPSLLSPQPTVQLRNGSGGLITNPLNQASVTLTVSPATPSFTCSGGSTTMTTVGGTASFSGCTLPAGTGYQLTANVAFDVTVLPITGASFNVAGRRLAFTQQPGGTNAIPGQALPTQPIVAVQDSAGVTQAAQNNGTVTLTIASGPVGATLTCTGGNARNVANGLATFAGCAMSPQGTGYSLTATYAPTLVGEPTVQPATSALFNVNATPAAVTLTLTAAPIPINPGQTSVLTVQFSTGANQPIAIQSKTALSPTFQTVVTLTTDANGRAVYTTLPLTFSTTYQAVFAGGGGLAAATSPAFVVGVRRTVTMAPQWSGNRTVARGTRLTFQSKIGPLNGVAVPRGTFQIYQQINGVWTFSTSATFATNSAGDAVFTWTFSRSGLWYVRWRANSDAYNVTAFSPINRVRVP